MTNFNPTATQLKAAVVGNFDKEVAAGLKQVEVALQAALFEYATEVRDKWRQDVAQSGLANAARMTKTIRTRNYRNKGLNPASQVYSTFPVLQKAFEQATTIRSKDGFWLVIPNPDVWPSGRVRRQGGRGARTSESTVAIAERRFGPLRFVYRPGGVSLLVTDARKSRTRAGAYRYASPTASKRGNVEEIVVFFVVREARLPRMLRGSVIRDRATRDADAAVDRLFTRHFQSAGTVAQLTGPNHD